MDREKLESAVSSILEAIGEDPGRPELASTPARAAEMFEELFAGVSIDPHQYLADTLSEQHDELIVLRDLRVRSMCEHHLVPMVGTAHIGYLPNNRIVGFDRLGKVVDAYGRRPQIQERLTWQIAETIEEMLRPHGVIVMLELEHMCMTIRGTRQVGSRVVTTAHRGRFDDDPGLRNEFYAMIGRQ